MEKAKVIKDVFDHTSLLKYLTDKWSLGPLGNRTQQANSFAGALLAAPRQDCLKEVAMPGPAPVVAPALSTRPSLSSHQTALFAMTQLFESLTDVAANAVTGRISRMILGFDGAVDVGIERVENFLQQVRSGGAGGAH